MINFPKIGFSDSMSLSNKEIVVCYSVIIALLDIDCITSSIYYSFLSNITVCIGVWVKVSWCAETVVTVGPGQEMTLDMLEMELVVTETGAYRNR